MTSPRGSIIALLLLASLAEAQTPAEAEYLRRVANALRTYGNLSSVSTPAQQRRRDSTMADLERRLRSIIGPVNVTGFPQPPRINKEAFCRDEVDCGMVDGLLMRTEDWSRTLVVTTPAIMTAWLDRESWNVGKGDRIETALRSANLMAGALGGNAAALHYADLPIAGAAAKGVMSAMLVLRAQDVGPWPPRQIMLTVRRPNRIYIIQVPTDVEIDAIPECTARLDSLYKAAFAKLPPSAPRMVSMKEDDVIHARHRACYAERLSTIPGIDRIIRQVDDIVAALPR